MTRILGIDFSGARDAGRKIWIAEAKRGSGPLAISRCFPASELPGSGADPETALGALRDFIIAEPDSVIGCDFPFGLPEPLIAAENWQNFALEFSQRFPDAETFHDLCHRASSGVEIKRRTDRAARTPFNSYNLRLYRQTWWGIAGLLAPLVAQSAISVRPQMPLRAKRPVMIEVCAASSLIAIDCYPAYKGRFPAHRRARRRILDCLIDGRYLAPLPDPLRRRILANAGGDALDAVIGAIAAGAADLRRPGDRSDRREGRVYVALSP